MSDNNLNVGLEGWLTWELLDSDGSVVQNATQHNMILDQGLDLIAVYGFFGIQSHAVVGSGTVAPSFAQTSMGSEVARTSDNGGAPEPFTKPSNGQYSRTFVREFTEASIAGKNLSEWGFAPTSTLNTPIAIRELFRDNSGSPIVITPNGSQKLRLSYIFTLTVGPTVAVPGGSFNIAGLGDITYTLGITHRSYRYSGGSWSTLTSDDYQVLNAWARASSGFSMGVTRTDLHTSYDYTTSRLDFSDVVFGTTTPLPYTNGTFRRSVNMFIPTSSVGTYVGMAACASQGGTSPYSALLGFGSSIVKNNLHTLNIDGITLSWGRA